MIIKVEDLKKTFKSYERGNTLKEVAVSLFVRKTKLVEAVKGISFSIDKGELVGFLGPNGAGKSTTLKVLTGILYPTSGKVDILGYTPWKDRKKYVSHIGAVFGQKSQLLWDIPPLDAFNLNKAIYSIPDKDFTKKLNYMVELLEVQNIIKKPTRLLSLGERMKCEFIMAMLHSPEIVFLDEPTIGLDVIAKEKIREFILEMNKQGVTFILTTHDLGDIEQLAKRVIVINHGEMIFDNTIDALKSHLGTKKLVSITTQEPIPALEMPGVLVKNKLTDYTAELELDVNIMELNQFIDYINKNSTINDMTLQELPIEEVIKNLYSI